MDAIAAPTDAPHGINQVMNSLRTKHELRILAEMGGAGFDNWDRVDEYSLRQFVDRFPSPADFDSVGNEFVDMIGRVNGSEKRTQYAAAMQSFKHKVYGEKQTYWEQMQAINALLGGSDTVPQFAGLSSAVTTPPTAERHQVERSAEWTPGLASASQVSRTQVRQGFAINQLHGGNLEADPTCQDAYLARQNEGFFGVFDGAGGEVGGREASHAAADSVNQACDKYNLKSGADLAYILNAANQPVRSATNGQGYTTATLAKVIEQDGRKMLAYASVGDSRLYIVHQNGSTDLITRDEGEGNRITNALGIAGDDRTRQYGEIPISSGDKVVLCSDGITGDYGDDLMSEAELGDIVQRSRTPEEATANLVTTARKTDDRTAIVFGI